MARPQKNTVEYFPFICKEGKGMYYIEQKHGNDGYAVWIKLLTALATTSDHFLDLSEPVELMFLSSKCRVPEEKLIEIISDLVKLKEFDKNIWVDHRVIWSDKFMENIEDAYRKRRNKPMTRGQLYSKYYTKSNNNGVYGAETKVSGAESPHTKLYNTIEDDTILDNSKLEEIREKEIPKENFDFFKNGLIKNKTKLEEMAIHQYLTIDRVLDFLTTFLIEKKIEDQTWKSQTDFNSHFFRWLRKQEKPKIDTKPFGIPDIDILIEEYELFRNNAFPNAPKPNWTNGKIESLKGFATKIRRSINKKDGEPITPILVQEAIQLFFKKFAKTKGFELENYSEPKLLNTKYDEIVKKLTTSKPTDNAESRSKVINAILAGTKLG